MTKLEKVLITVTIGVIYYVAYFVVNALIIFNSLNLIKVLNG